MRLNADFALPVVIRPGDAPWVASPLAGVERQMLDRIGEELARVSPRVVGSRVEHGQVAVVFDWPSRWADAKASAKSSARSTLRIPLPPPPATALISTG